ncbi:uncharacterized protein MYCFIDRAFT_171051 [Pseudocercospora fijiensis CIRAD86]|uniref:Uncharacterized protein n=1 Tax=Pseudocercospora fijiensis (strain CIRAD86) TaxID=383855 RepID=N1Q9S2_PSEFD|nr:uncharacterized protein MYCFIDRAFT_171051 [Pseudocercospora fijiensis CIRAD86]EME89624.1 hypothetical protein MYCFIDRAFT_171051 [Pseudocercospora fijiensis CIRAD86]
MHNRSRGSWDVAPDVGCIFHFTSVSTLSHAPSPGLVCGFMTPGSITKSQEKDRMYQHMWSGFIMAANISAVLFQRPDWSSSAVHLEGSGSMLMLPSGSPTRASQPTPLRSAACHRTSSRTTLQAARGGPRSLRAWHMKPPFRISVTAIYEEPVKLEASLKPVRFLKRIQSDQMRFDTDTLVSHFLHECFTHFPPTAQAYNNVAMDRSSLDPAILEELDKSDLVKECRKFHQQHGRMPSMKDMQRSKAFRDALGNAVKDLGKPGTTSGYGDSKYPYSSAAPSPGCRDACEECSEQYRTGLGLATRPYEEFLSDNEARQKVEYLREKTEENLSHVRQQLKTYGNAIMKRWLKRNVSKRANLLTQAMPELYSQKASFVQEMLKITRFLDKDRKLTRKINLMPYLSIELLSENPNNLLALLYYRTHFNPVQWAAFDCHQFSYFLRSGMMEATYNPHCITNDHAWRMGHSQELLSRQLRAVVGLLLNPQPENAQSGCDVFETLAATGFATTAGAITQDVTLTSPFSAPPCLNMAEIVATLRSRLQACEDELWLLQTDADYLREHLAKIDSSLAQESFSGGSREELKLQVVMINITKVEDWQYLLDEAEQAMSIMSELSSRVRPGHPLPEQYANALAIFEFALSLQFHRQQNHLGKLITASSDFRQYFSYVDKEIGALGIDASLQKTHRHDPIFYNLAMLHTHESHKSFPAALHVRHLDGLLASRPHEEARRISRMMYMAVSDMAVIDDTLTKIKLHRPQGLRMTSLMSLGDRPKPTADENSIIELVAGLDPPQMERWMEKLTEKHVFDSFYTISNYEYLHPVLQMLEHQPRCTGRYETRDLDAFDKSQKALFEFWQAMREWRLHKILTSFDPIPDLDRAMKKVFPSTIEEYRRDLEEERAAMAAAVEAKSFGKCLSSGDQREQNRIFHLKRSVWGFTSTENTAVQQVKEKKKSRPLHSDLQTLSIAEPHQESFTTPQETIAVDKTSLTVFRRMYASALAKKGHINWDDFVAALIDIGFSVMPNSGSAVTFKEKSGKGSIVFHRPHPDSHIDPIMLKSMGKRLRKWFGYDKETFIEHGLVASSRNGPLVHFIAQRACRKSWQPIESTSREYYEINITGDSACLWYISNQAFQDDLLSQGPPSLVGNTNSTGSPISGSNPNILTLPPTKALSRSQSPERNNINPPSPGSIQLYGRTISIPSSINRDPQSPAAAHLWTETETSTRSIRACRLVAGAGRRLEFRVKDGDDGGFGGEEENGHRERGMEGIGTLIEIWKRRCSQNHGRRARMRELPPFRLVMNGDYIATECTSRRSS